MDLPGIAQNPGALFHREDGSLGGPEGALPGAGPSGCPRCGWSGVPTFLFGVRQNECPACEATGTEEFIAELLALRAEPVYPRVGRNQPCPCGSGRKYKKCHGKVE